jgi:hypothetical protein
LSKRNSILKNNDSVRIELVGGLGNQLFQFFAGKFLADKLERNLTIISSRIGHSATNHGFFLPNLINDNHLEVLSQRFPKIYNEYSRTADYLDRKVLRLSFPTRISNFYTSPSIGYDKELVNQSGNLIIKGYFQTYVYFQSNPEYRKMVGISSPSNWYLTQSARILLEKPLIIHIRRGDYKSLSTEFGLLSQDYYQSAVLMLQNRIGTKRCIVFSDDVPEAREIMRFVPGNQIEFIEPPSESNPAENLLLMSQGSALVTANSTFSLWAGLLMNDECLVATPTDWFRGRKNPELLRPEKWLRIESKWSSTSN